MRILIADDHRVVRAGLRLLLQGAGYQIAGEASSAPEALALARSVQPDLIILDLSMPGGSGLDHIKELAAAAPVLVLTMHDDPAYVRQVLAGGARGYVLKEAADVELLAAVAAVSSGQSYIYPTLAARMLSEPKPAAEPAAALSPREREVLRLIALGHTNQEIAEQLQVGVRTVETYKVRVSEKLGLHTRSELVRFALQQKLI